MNCSWHTCDKSTKLGLRGFKKFCSKQCKNKYYVDRRRKALKQKAVDYKGGCCNICSYSKCIQALEFHHLDPGQKDFGISSSGTTKSWKRIKDELDKCVMLCSNCHKEVHANLAFPEFTGFTS